MTDSEFARRDAPTAGNNHLRRLLSDAAILAAPPTLYPPKDES